MKQTGTGLYIQGYYIPNIRRLTDEVIKILDISAPVSIFPRKSDYPGYVEKKDGGYTIYIDPAILKKDELTDFVVSLFIHEMWHVRQMEAGRLTSNSAGTVAVWEGVHYPMTVIPHGKRPWEIEAKEMAVVYDERVKEQIAVSIK